jgi:uncharacterized protein YjcR
MKAKQDKETRLDRIEKGIEKLFEGLGALTESQKNYSEERREAQKKIDSEILELKDSQMKTDEQLSRTIKKLDDIGRQLGDLGLVQGEVAEDLFYRNVR